MNKSRLLQHRQGLLVLISLGLGWMLASLGCQLITDIANIISTIFVNILKMLSLPLVFLTIVSTVANLGTWENVRTVGSRILRYTLLTTFVAAAIALALYRLIDPAASVEAPANVMQPPALGYSNALVKVFPENFLQPFLSGNVIGILVLAILVSIALVSLPSEQRETSRKLFSALSGIFLKMAEIVVKVIPLAILAFTIQLVNQLQTGLQLTSIGWYVACIVSANLVQAIVVLPALLISKGISPLQLCRHMSRALLTAFLSKSSAAALPVTIACAEENAKINPKISRIVLPICTTINMNACAGFILVTYFFVAQMNGYEFHLGEQIAWVFIASIAAMGNAAVPMGCYYLATALLAASDVPLALMGLIFPLYTLLDMLETAINVWSDCSITAIVNKETDGRLGIDMEQ